MDKITKQKKKKFRYIIRGDILVEHLLLKHPKLLILIVILFIFFISNKYSCMKKIVEIEALEEQLKNIKYQNLIISTKLAFNSRLSQIEKLLESRDIGLFISNTQIFKLRK